MGGRVGALSGREKNPGRSLIVPANHWYDAAGLTPVKLIQNYINGKFVSAKSRFSDINPADGSVIAEVTEADKNNVDDAVQAARSALRGEWGDSVSVSVLRFCTVSLIRSKNILIALLPLRWRTRASRSHWLPNSMSRELPRIFASSQTSSRQRDSNLSRQKLRMARMRSTMRYASHWAWLGSSLLESSPAAADVESRASPGLR